MVQLHFNMLGFIYESGVKSLRQSYLAASKGLQHQVENAEKALADYLHQVEIGGQRIGEWEDGHRLWEQDQVHEYEIEAAKDAYDDLRKAFMIAAYHYWERSMRKYCNATKANHSDLVKKAIAEGFPISSKLERVHRMANALKHNSDSHGEKLRECWPDVVMVVHRPVTNINWYAVITLRDEHVLEVFAIIEASGPQRRLAGFE